MKFFCRWVGSFPNSQYYIELAFLETKHSPKKNIIKEKK